MNRWQGVTVVVVAAVVGLSAVRTVRSRDNGTNEQPVRAIAAYAPRIDPADFSTTVDNPFFPLVPGTRWVYNGAGDAGEVEQKVVEVTRQTRKVMGVTTVVVRDTVTSNDELVEDTFDWYAQHKDGSVWYFGEDTTEYEHGKPVGHKGAWEGGVNRAQPGITMKGAPALGQRYRQEYRKGHAEDEAEVVTLDAHVAVSFGAFTGVLITKDTTPLEPATAERKSYAPGVGTIREETIAGGSSQLQLVEMTHA
jgi:hypothetical protein